MSNFHGVTQYGSKIRHATVTGVTVASTIGPDLYIHTLHHSDLEERAASAI